MIAAWMLGSTLFALLLSIAAFCVERILRMIGRPTRSPWAVALVLGVAWPLMAPLALAPPQNTTSGIPLIISVGDMSPAAMIAAQLPSQLTVWEQRAATLLLVVWIGLSALMLVRLLIAARVLARVTRTAKHVQVDGESVLVTESLGPAVIGLWTPKVAVPEWFLQLDGSLRAMVLRHEREHCNSHDPQLVWLASLSVALMPWNLGVWFLSRRLRLALEIDCDARTLRRDIDTTKYGRLLLLIAQRQSSYPLASMLAESTSHLSQRITAMQMLPLRKPVVRVVLFAGIAAGAIAVACSPRVASDLTGPGDKPVSATAAKLEAQKMGPGAVYFESQVEIPVAPAPGSSGPIYPAELKANGIEGTVLAMFVVNEQGLPEVASFKVLRADDPRFAESVRTALPNMRFISAKVGGRPVKQLVQQPFSFALGRNMRPTTTDAVLQPTNATERKLAAKRGTGVNTLKPGSTPASAANAGAFKKEPAVVNGPYFESQVERSAGFADGFKGPQYPATLKAQGIEGSVLVQFVVNADGSAEMSSFKVLRTDNPGFTNAARDAIAAGQFNPALVGGRAVRQLMTQPFAFSLSR